MTTTTAVPDSLIRLREAYRARVEAERREREEKEAAAALANWQTALACVEKDLPADLLPFADLERPEAFCGETESLWVEIRLPGHWPIGALYARDAGWFRDVIDKHGRKWITYRQVSAEEGFDRGVNHADLGEALCRAYDAIYEE